MLELFLKLVDRIIDLVNATHLRLRAQFSEVAQPLFTSLEPIANNYFALFNRALSALEGGEFGVENLRELRGARAELEPARIKVRAMATAIRNQPSLASLHEFADSVQEFFYFGEAADSYPNYSIGRELIDVLELLVASDVGSRDAKLYTEAAMEGLRRHWNAVVAAYTALQIAAAAQQKA
jgi:hypothetical protein